MTSERAKRTRGIVAAVVAGAALAAPSVARADFETWVPVELRVPLYSTEVPRFPRVDLRVITEARFALRFNGLEQAFLRVGPIFYLSRFFFLALHGSIAADAAVPAAGMPTRLQEEARFELEPNFFGRLGPLTFLNRNRFEYRWRQDDQRTRLRLLLRVNAAPVGWRVMPFVQEEMLFDLTDTRPAGTSGVPPTPGFNQNRLQVGVGIQILPNVRLDVAFLLRVRAQPGMSEWAYDMGPWVQLFIDVPPRPAAPPAPAPAPAPAPLAAPTPAPAAAPPEPATPASPAGPAAR